MCFGGQGRVFCDFQRICAGEQKKNHTVSDAPTKLGAEIPEITFSHPGDTGTVHPGCPERSRVQRIFSFKIGENFPENARRTRLEL